MINDGKSLKKTQPLFLKGFRSDQECSTCSSPREILKNETIDTSNKSKKFNQPKTFRSPKPSSNVKSETSRNQDLNQNPKLQTSKSISIFQFFCQKQVAMHKLKEDDAKKAEVQLQDKKKTEQQSFPNNTFKSMLNKTEQVKKSPALNHSQTECFSIQPFKMRENHLKTASLNHLQTENQNLKHSLEQALYKLETLSKLETLESSQIFKEKYEKTLKELQSSQLFIQELQNKVNTLNSENLKLKKDLKTHENNKVSEKSGPRAEKCSESVTLNEKILSQADELFEKNFELKMIREQRADLLQNIRQLEEDSEEMLILREHVHYLLNKIKEYKLKLYLLARDIEHKDQTLELSKMKDYLINTIKELANLMKKESDAFAEKRANQLNGFFGEALTDKFKQSMTHFIRDLLEKKKFDKE